MKKVEGEGNCFILIKSEHDKRFGGFRSVPFGRANGEISDMKSFIFSLDEKVKGAAIEGKAHLNESSDRLVFFTDSFAVYANYTQKPSASSWASLTGNKSFQKILP